MNFQFDSLMELLAMDGHGVYVWTAFIITFLTIGLLIVVPQKLKRHLVIQVKRQQRIEAATLSSAVES